MTAEEFKRKIDKIPLEHWPNDPKVTEIYHYCNSAALYGIVTEKSLWASDVFSLNDASEVYYGFRLVIEVLEKYPPMAPIAQFIGEGSLLSLVRTWNTHVCCFSSDKDSLSQWRAYGAGGYGFAIGFNRQLLEEEAKSSGEFVVVQMAYSREHQLNLIEEFLQAASNVLQTFEPTVEHYVALVAGLLALVLPIKNPGFADEREWRILSRTVQPTEILFRPMHGAVVPYSKISLQPTYFTRIVQGPTLHKDFGEQSLKMFLEHNGLQQIPVESSKIPLRSL